MGKNRIWLCLLLLPLLSSVAWREDAVQAMAEQPRAYIALTFDDSPNGALTERLLDGLRERDAHATFFVIGEQIQGQEALLRRMAAEGHQIGNHTWTHRRLDNSGDIGAKELRRTEQELEQLLGGEAYWVRPPWGFASAETVKEVQTPMVYWSLDTEDWKVLNRSRICAAIVKQAKDGDIVLLHDAYATSVDAALDAIDILREQGYAFVTLEELFRHMGVAPEQGQLYCRPDQVRSIG